MIFLFGFCFPSRYCHHAFSYRIVILSIAKDLITSTLCMQILHCVQDDTSGRQRIMKGIIGEYILYHQVKERREKKKLPQPLVS